MAYHSILKERIQNDELLGVEYIENYLGSNSRLLLYFKSEPKIRPILQHKIEEYRELLENINTKFEQLQTRYLRFNFSILSKFLLFKNPRIFS